MVLAGAKGDLLADRTGAGWGTARFADVWIAVIYRMGRRQRGHAQRPRCRAP
jgi:hypothetical protein